MPGDRRSRSTYECGCILIGDEGARDGGDLDRIKHPLTCPVHGRIWTSKQPERARPAAHDSEEDSR
jgi:hypothetical protein